MQNEDAEWLRRVARGENGCVRVHSAAARDNLLRIADLIDGDWVKAAAKTTLDEADYPPPERSATGHGPQHASWMLEEIVVEHVTGRKAHRWLGYAQGVLVETGYLTLKEAKDANKAASDAAGEPDSAAVS